MLKTGEETTNTYFIVFDLVYSNVETGRRNNKYLFYSLWFGLQQLRLGEETTNTYFIVFDLVYSNWDQEKKQQIPIL